MKNISQKFIAGIGIAGIVILLAAPIANAQNNNSTGQALEISPPLITLSADPGEIIKTQISLRNVSNGKLRVEGQINDFVAQGEDGTPKILLEDPEENPYSIKDWVSPLSQLTLTPRQIETFPITIAVPADASPGGHYGVVRFTATPPELEGTGVSLSASLGTLILLNINGDTQEKLEILDFSVSRDGKSGKLFEATPIDFFQRIKNSGNTHSQPAGQITITDMFGKKVATVNINLPPRNILPNSTRKFDQTLDKSTLGDKRLFGKYTADLNITYGANKDTVSQKITFWIIPYKLIGIAIAVLVIGFFVLRFAIRRYNQKIISKAGGSGSKRKR